MKTYSSILAIDTSCDETSVAITVHDRVLANVVSSQVELHKKWGGVVPIIAKRAHVERIDAVIAEALKQANILQLRSSIPGVPSPISLDTIDALAVTQGPGLAPALEVGIVTARSLAQKHNTPLIAVNHMEGHLLSSHVKNSQGNNPGGSTLDAAHFPLVGLLISGGHTQLVRVDGIGSYTLLGETLDDAIGEAYDKVAKMLSLGYPGGPIIERLAQQGDAYAYDFPVPMRGRKDMHFSYSGLKTALKYKIQDIQKTKQLSKQTICDLAASFQRVAVRSLTHRLNRAITEVQPKGILLGGGVVSNVYVRKQIRAAAKKQSLPVYIPYSKKLFTDNAAMIGVAAYYKAQRGEFVADIDALDRSPNLSF